MTPDILSVAQNRHAAKAYDPARRIADADMARVRDLLRFSPSSINLQPWHFVIAGSAEGKARIARAAQGRYAMNEAAIRNASHVVVFAGRLEADDAYLRHVLAQEEKDGRFAADPAAFRERQHQGRSFFVDRHRTQLGDARAWMAHQVYLNLGQFLLGVAALGIDATPMEGVDLAVLDAELGLTEMGYGSLCIVPIGYADPAGDYNAALPKSRLPLADILTEI